VDFLGERDAGVGGGPKLTKVTIKYALNAVISVLNKE
jgi:hypothetical protein